MQVQESLCDAYVYEENTYCTDCGGGLPEDGAGNDGEEQYRPGFSKGLSKKIRGMLRNIQDVGGRSFCCYFVREGECRNALRCEFPHLTLEEVKALKKEHPGSCSDGRPCVQCDNAWFDGNCYHRDLKEHP